MFAIIGVITYLMAKLVRMNKKLDLSTKLYWIDKLCCITVVGFCIEFMLFWISIINII